MCKEQWCLHRIKNDLIRVIPVSITYKCEHTNSWRTNEYNDRLLLFNDRAKSYLRTIGIKHGVLACKCESICIWECHWFWERHGIVGRGRQEFTGSWEVLFSFVQTKQCTWLRVRYARALGAFTKTMYEFKFKLTVLGEHLNFSSNHHLHHVCQKLLRFWLANAKAGLPEAADSESNPAGPAATRL